MSRKTRNQAIETAELLEGTVANMQPILDAARDAVADGAQMPSGFRRLLIQTLSEFEAGLSQAAGAVGLLASDRSGEALRARIVEELGGDPANADIAARLHAAFDRSIVLIADLRTVVHGGAAA